MKNELKKPNDIFVATLKAPQASVLDLYQNSLTPDNTSFLSMDEYRQTPLVQKLFSENDVFNEQAFEETYLLAAQKYQDLTNKKAADELAKQLEYSQSSRYKPLGANIRSNQSKYENLVNPLGYSYGINGINKQGDPLYTEEENAQSNRIWDSKNNKWLDETPESRPLYKKLFGDTLVYAQWDENGTHIDPITGQEIEHFAGQRKTDENGNYYTELIGDQDLLNKKVVSVSDILTKEDSWLNKYDFFDSDGYDKSTAGIATKTLISIAPYLIPGFNAYYGAATAALGLASVLPTVYKSLEGLFTGETSSDLAKSATKLENWFRKFDSSTSKAGQGFWNLEAVGNLTVDIFGQLYQQRAAGSLAKFIKDAGAQNKAARQFALGYMGLISGADVYNDALTSGYDKRTAGLASLATMSGLYGIMNFNESTRGLGTWFLRETTGYEQDVLRAPVSKLVRSLLPKFEKGIKDLGEGNAKTLATTLKEYKVKAKKLAMETLIEPTESMWKSAIVEGVEEVSEEVIQDSIKGIIDTLSWFGLTGSQGSFGGFENVFSQQGLERYLATLFGGAAGGALFHLNIDHIEPFINRLSGKSAEQKKMDYTTIQALIAGRGEDIKKEIRRQAGIINNSLAAGATQVGDNLVYLNKEGQSQADLAAEAAIRYIEGLEKFIDSDVKAAVQFFGQVNPNFDKLSDEIKRQIVSSAYSSSFAAQTKFDEYMLDAFAARVTDLLEAKRSLEQLDETASQEAKQTAQSNFDLKKQDLQNFFTGKQNINFGIEYKILENSKLRSFLLSLDPESYAYNTYGIEDFNALSPEEKENILSEWRGIQEDSGDTLQDSLPRLRALLQALLSRNSRQIANYANSQHKQLFVHKLYKDDTYEQERTAIITNPELSDEEKQALLIQLDGDRIPKYLSKIIKEGNTAFTLSDILDIKLGEKLIKDGIIELEGFSKEEEKYVQKLIDSFAAHSRINYWSKEALEQLIANVNDALLPSSNNLYAKKIAELRAQSSKEEENENTDSAIGIQTLGYVNLNQEALEKNPDISFFKLNAIEQYFNNDQIDQDLYDILEKTYNPILEQYGALDSNLKYFINEYLEAASIAGKNRSKNNILDYAEEEGSVITKADANKLIKTLETLSNLKGKIGKANPLIQVAKNIYSQITGSSLGSDIFDALDKQESRIRDIAKFAAFELSEDDITKLASASHALDVINAMAESMVSDDNYKGISELSREFIDLYGGNDAMKENFQLISREDAGEISKWVAQTKDKIHLLVSISEQVVRDLREEDRRNEENHYNNLQAFYQKLIEDDKFTFTVQDAQFKLALDSSLNPDLPTQEYCYKVEQSIYNSIQSFLKENPGISRELFIDSIIQLVSDNHFDTDGDITDIDYDVTTAVTQDATKRPKINSNFFARRLSELVYYSPKEYIDDITKIYGDNPNTDPGFGQGLVLRSILSAIHDYPTTQHVIEKIGVHEDSSQFIGKNLMTNTITIIGAPGSGKNHIISLLKNKLGKVTAVSKTERKVKSLAKDLGLPSGQTLAKFLGDEIFGAATVFDEGLKVANHLLLNKDFSEGNITEISEGDVTVKKGEKDNTFIAEIQGKDSSENTYKIIVELAVFDDNTNLQRITVKDFGIKAAAELEIKDSLVIDEATFLSPYITQLLNNQAKQHNAKVFLLGDQTQMGWSTIHNNVEVPYNIQSVGGIHTPSLVTTYRGANTGKTVNTNIVRGSLVSSILQDDQDHTLPAYLSLYKSSPYPGNAFKKYFTEANRALHYFISNDGSHMGDLVTNDVNQFTQIVNTLKQTRKSIAVVVPEVNENNPIYQEAKSLIGDGVTYLTLQDIQGDEFDYVIGYKLPRTSGQRNDDIDVQKVNMLITRSREFGIYFDNMSDHLFSHLGIRSISDSTIRKMELISTDVVSKDKIDELHAIANNLPEESAKEETKTDLSEDDDTIEEATEDEGTEGPKDSVITSEEEENSKEQETIKSLGLDQKFVNASGIHSVFVRLGLTRDQVAELKKINTPDDVKLFIDNISDKQYDLSAFFYEFDRIKQLYDGKLTINNGQDLLDYYEIFTHDVFKFWQEGKLGTTIGIIYSKYDPNVDYAYNKVNNNPEFEPRTGNGYLRIAIKIGDRYISIGRLGYNQDREGNLISQTQQNIFDKLNAEGITQVVDYTYRPNSESAKIFENYYSSRGINTKNPPAKLYAYDKGIYQYTSERPYKIQDTKSNSALFGEFLYGRITLDQLERIGWRINNSIAGYQYDPSQDVEKEIARFKEWYSQFRLEELKDDDWVSKVYKRNWAVIQFQASETSVEPVLLNEVSEQIDIQFTNTTKRIKLFSLKQILQGLNKLISNSEQNLFDGLNSYQDREKIAEKIEILKGFIDSNITSIAGGTTMSGNSVQLLLDRIKIAFLTGNKGKEGINITSGNDIDTLLKILNESFPEYFYKTSFADEPRRENIRISIIFEPPRYLLDWEQFIPVSQETQQIQTQIEDITEESPVEPMASQQDIETSQEFLNNNEFTVSDDTITFGDKTIDAQSLINGLRSIVTVNPDEKTNILDNLRAKIQSLPRQQRRAITLLSQIRQEINKC